MKLRFYGIGINGKRYDFSSSKMEQIRTWSIKQLEEFANEKLKEGIILKGEYYEN